MVRLGQHDRQLAVWFQAVQRSFPLVAIAMKGAGPQSSARIGAAVVESHAGLRLHVAEQRHLPSRCDMPQLAFDGQDQTAVLAEHRRADVALRRERGRLARRGVPSVHQSTGDVDADQLVAAVVPHRTLAQFVGPEDGNARLG